MRGLPRGRARSTGVAYGLVHEHYRHPRPRALLGQSVHRVGTLDNAVRLIDGLVAIAVASRFLAPIWLQGTDPRGAYALRDTRLRIPQNLGIGDLSEAVVLPSTDSD